MIAATHRSDRFQDLAEPCRRLLRVMQAVDFGRITVHVRHGEPDLHERWHTRRTVKLAGGENRPRPEAALTDFELCREQEALLDALKHVRDGARVSVEVRHGLPFLVEIEQDHQAA